MWNKVNIKKNKGQMFYKHYKSIRCNLNIVHLKFKALESMLPIDHSRCQACAEVLRHFVAYKKLCEWRELENIFTFSRPGLTSFHLKRYKS